MERLYSISKVTQLVNGRARIPTQAVQLDLDKISILTKTCPLEFVLMNSLYPQSLGTFYSLSCVNLTALSPEVTEISTVLILFEMILRLI